MKGQVGDIYYANLPSKSRGSEQQGDKPVLILDVNGNTVLVAVITSRQSKAKIPTHVFLAEGGGRGLNKDSILMLEQVYTIGRFELMDKLGHLSESDIPNVRTALLTSFGISQLRGGK